MARRPITIADICSMGDIIRAHEAAGGHFFSPGAMRFFDSTICEATLTISRRGRAYFVTSEQFHGSRGSRPRRYTLRRWDPATPREVETVGAFQQYADYSGAARACTRAALADK